MTLLEELNSSHAPTVTALISATDQSASRLTSEWNNQATWDNSGGGPWNNEPSWDNWPNSPWDDWNNNPSWSDWANR